MENYCIYQANYYYYILKICSSDEIFDIKLKMNCSYF